MRNTFTHGPWHIEYTPEDGGRLDRIAYNAFDLVTTAPAHFQKPAANYGEYENRPVYGYDDCFPSVEACPYPGIDWRIPDHGEVCWLNWKSREGNGDLVFETESRALPVRLTREMHCEDAALTWKFEVYNWGDIPLPFQHVMHPLMKLDDIVRIDVPECTSVFESRTRQILPLNQAREIGEYLVQRPRGTATMLFLRGIRDGNIRWLYKNGLQLAMRFPLALFPAIGIWWNNNGYPAEPGIERNECAFEPIPGNSSNLSEVFQHRQGLTVPSRGRFCWQITWDLES